MDRPRLVEWTLAIEEASVLDGPVQRVAPVVEAAFATGTRGEVLRGEWLGHALHPLLTDLVLGSWTSATVLDVVGGQQSRTAARRLLGVGLLAAGPTAWTGWAEWSEAGARDRRVGLVHAITNGLAIATYTSSWLARRRGEHGKGVRRALAGAAIASVGGYLGGHLAAARKVGTHDAAFDAV